VESFHGPVRDGKGWYRLAMVIRHEGLPRRIWGAPQPIWKKRKEGGLCCFWHNTDLNLCVCYPVWGFTRIPFGDRTRVSAKALTLVETHLL
jgi:hypothetical protein